MDRRLPEEMAPGYELLGPVRRAEDMPKRTPPEVVEKIRALRAEGKKLAEIAEECGVSKVTVRRYVVDSALVAHRTEQPALDAAQQREAKTEPGSPPSAADAKPAEHLHSCDSNPNAATPPRPLLSIRERGPGERLRGLLVGAGEMVAALGGQVEVAVSVRRVEG